MEIREQVLNELKSVLDNTFPGNQYTDWFRDEGALAMVTRTLEKIKKTWTEQDFAYVHDKVYRFTDRPSGHQGELFWDLHNQHNSLELAEIITTCLPYLLRTNGFENIPDQKKSDYLESLAEKIENLYPDKTEDTKSLALENLCRVPLKLLQKDNLLTLPTENYEFYCQLLPLCSTFEDFNHLILRKEGQEKRYYQELFSVPELKKLGEIGNLNDIIARISRSGNQKAWNFIFQGLQYQSLLERACHLYQNIGGSTRVGLAAEKLFAFDVHENPEVELGRYQRFFDAVESKKTGINWPDVLGGSKTLQLHHRNTWLRGLFASSFLRGYAILDLFLRWHDINKYPYERDARKKLNQIVYDHWVKTKASNEPYRLDESIAAAFSEMQLEPLLKTMTPIIPLLAEHSGALYTEIMERSKSNELPADMRDKEHKTIATLEHFLEELVKDKYFKRGAADEFRNAIHRILTGLRLPVNVDQFRVESNGCALFDLVNNINECTSVGGKFESYGYAQARDKHLGIIAANLYYHTSYQETVGKAFMAECKNERDQKVLLVDGVVMQQDIAELLPCIKDEPLWMIYFTSAILETAQAKQMEYIILNVSHSSAQRSVWRYNKHLADLLGLKEGKDYFYRENLRQVMTTSQEGFQLTDESVKKNLHYLEKVRDSSCPEEHFLAGFWINHWDPAQDSNNPPKKYSPLPSFIVRQHKEQPYINDGKGPIIGLKISTEELSRLLKQKYT